MYRVNIDSFWVLTADNLLGFSVLAEGCDGIRDCETVGCPVGSCVSDVEYARNAGPLAPAFNVPLEHDICGQWTFEELTLELRNYERVGDHSIDFTVRSASQGWNLVDFVSLFNKLIVKVEPCLILTRFQTFLVWRNVVNWGTQDQECVWNVNPELRRVGEEYFEKVEARMERRWFVGFWVMLERYFGKVFLE